jgi:predicted aspartyl protease
MPMTRRSLTHRLLLGALCAVQFAPPLHAACGPGTLASLPLTMIEHKLLVPVSLNGSPEQLALDTGAGITVISTEAAGRLNIPHDFDRAAEVSGVGGANSVLYIGQLDTLDLAGIRLKHQNYPIVDLPMHAADGTPVSGFLGADVLHNFDVDIDIPRGRLDLWRTSCPDSMPPWQEDTPAIPFDLDSGNHILVPFKVDGVTLTGVLDTGAYGFSMTTRAAYRAGITDDALDNDIQIHGTGVNNRAWTGHLHHFQKVVFGGATYTRLMADIIPSTGAATYDGLLGADALLGVPLLQNARLWISYRSHTLYLLPADRGSGGQP